MNTAYITDIFWDRIYLNIIIKTENFEIGEVVLFKKGKICERFKTEKIEKDKYKVIINITNINNARMLEDGTYSFKFYNEPEEEYKITKDGEQREWKEEEKYTKFYITNELGYRLESLDKVFRYKNYYAYTLNFFVKKFNEDFLTVHMRSMFMVAEKMPTKLRLKKKLIRFAKKTFRCMYKVFDFLHPNKSKKVLLMSETRSPISGNLKALDEQIRKRGINDEYKISYSFFKSLELSNIRLLFKWVGLAWKISKQETIFIDDYSPIFKYIDLNKKKAKLVQVWHAGVGFKSVGYARFGFAGPEPYNSCHRKYDYAIVGAKGLIPVYSEVFGIDKEKILPYGLPRLDNFLDKERIDVTVRKLHNKYPVLKGKKVILFAPTFRGKGQKSASYPWSKIDLEKTYELCKKDNYIFVFKMHPFIRKRIEIPEEYKDRIIDLSDYSDINDLLYLADILITDYSSTIYDFSMLKRPILFYTFDIEQYELINKVHRPIKEYAPGKVCLTYDELLEAIENKDFEIEKLQRYLKENFDEHNKKSTDMIIDNLILKGEKND